MPFSPFEIAELFARSEVEIRETLATAEDSDIAGVCRVRGVQVGTSREETVEILIAHIASSEKTSSGAKTSGANVLSTTEMQSIKELPEAELTERLKAMKADQLRQLCGHVGTGIHGKKEDMQARIFDAIKASCFAPSETAKSPEGRDGRHRSPKHGTAATAMRALVASDETAAGQAAAAAGLAADTDNSQLAKSPTVAAFLDEAVAQQAFPQVQPPPGFVQVQDDKSAGQNVVIQQVGTDAQPALGSFNFGSASTQAQTANAVSSAGLFNDSFADTPGSCAAPEKVSAMAVDEESSDVSEAPEVTEQVSMQEIMRKLNTMEKQIKHSEKRTREKTRVMIPQAVDPLKNTVHDVQSSVVELQRGHVIDSERI